MATLLSCGLRVDLNVFGQSTFRLLGDGLASLLLKVPVSTPTIDLCVTMHTCTCDV
jgi:hypothetical protein